MVCAALDGKTCFGLPRKKVACCGVVTLLVAAAAITTALVILLQPPDDIETVQKNDSDAATSAADLTVLRTAVLNTPQANGTMSVLQVAADSSYFVAFNDMRVAPASDCEELEVRLLSSGATSTATDGVLVVPLTADVISTADFTEPLEEDFDVDLYDQAALWCTTADATEEQLGTSVDLATPTTAAGGSTVVSQATLSGAGSYTVDGLVQILGSGSIVDDVLITSYSLRFQNIEVDSGPDVFLYLTTDAGDPEDVDAEGSLTVIVDGAERGTFSFTGNFSQTVPDGFVDPADYVAAVVWCDQFDVLFGSGLFEDV